MPSAAPSRPLASEPCASTANITNAISTSVKYSHGPNCSANRASAGDMPARKIHDTMPPTTEAAMPSASARSACLFTVMG